MEISVIVFLLYIITFPILILTMVHFYEYIDDNFEINFIIPFVSIILFFILYGLTCGLFLIIYWIIALYKYISFELERNKYIENKKFQEIYKIYK